MTYKGYTSSLTGVYKLERGEKKYSLQIRNTEDKVVYESAHIYLNEKEAFNEAKKLIKQALEKQKQGMEEQQAFAGVICKEPLRLPVWERINWTRVKKVAHVINECLVIALVVLHISQFFFMDFDMENEELNWLMQMMGMLYAFLGLLFALVMGYWGMIAKSGYTLNSRQKKIWSIIWWLNLLLNKGPAIPYNDQPFEKEPGWYSSTPLIEIIFEGFFAFFLLLGANGYFLFSVIITLALIVILYFGNVTWEVAVAGEKCETFPYRRVFIPWFSIFVIAACSYILYKLIYG